MNLSQVQKLQNGDLVEFTVPFPLFTVGKKYKVRSTSVGIYINDDNNIGWAITTEINLENHFKINKVIKKLGE